MKHSRTRFAFARTGVLCAIAFLAVAVACEARMPTSAEVDAMNVASAEKSAIDAKLLAEKISADRVYLVDGMKVTSDEAHALASSKIARVNIVGKKSAADKEEVRIYTTKLDKELGGEELKNMKMKIRSLRDSTIERVSARQLSKKSFDGVLLIDGVVAPSGKLAELSPDKIASVEVIKGAEAMKMSSDPAAVNGIVSVKLKAKQ